jgi:hypothetical protein
MLVTCLLALACGDSSGGASSSEGTDTKVCVAHNAPEPAKLQAAAPASFENDVAPLLVKSCSFSACHSSTGPTNHGLFLGATTPERTAQVKSGLIAATKAAPSMQYVTPGDPDKSFIMHKLDGDQCVVAESCADGTCGNSMPDGNALLAEEQRDVIRRWIAQGAK